MKCNVCGEEMRVSGIAVGPGGYPVINLCKCTRENEDNLLAACEVKSLTGWKILWMGKLDNPAIL